jgi:hypothetical protein
VEVSLDLSLLATPGDKGEQGKSWENQTLGLYPATKYSSQSQKTAILQADFLACWALRIAKIAPHAICHEQVFF